MALDFTKIGQPDKPKSPKAGSPEDYKTNPQQRLRGWKRSSGLLPAPEVLKKKKDQTVKTLD